MTMFEESANRHLILSTRQQSSEIRHIRFVFYRSAICQEKVQEHSWTWMVCFLFSKRDMWRPTGDLQNLSRSYLKLISSVQCIYCISQAHNQDFALQVIIPYKHIWDLLPDRHRSLCRQSGTNEFPEGPSDEWKCTMTVRGEAWTSTCHIYYLTLNLFNYDT